MHCTMWSNSCEERVAVTQGQQRHRVAGWYLGAWEPQSGVYLLTSALHDLQRDGEDLVVHSHRPPSTSDLHQEDSEVGSPQIQGEELPLLCSRENGGCIPLTCKEQGLV